MHKIIKRWFISIWVFLSSIWVLFAWNGLVAENGDILNLTKWNEMVAELNAKISFTDIKAGNNINLSYSGAEITINWVWWGWSGWWVPYITTDTLFSLWTNQSQNISLDWLNFTPTSTLIIPDFDGTINSVTAVSPVRIDANITSGNSTRMYDIVVSNDWILSSIWPGNWANLLNIGSIIWTWPAWTYTESFESNNLWNWLAVSWLTANVSFQAISGGTASSNTGPTSASQWLYYIFTEASSPNYPTRTFAIETQNFRSAQSISFDYHMFGADMGTLVVQTFYNNTWTDVYTLAWQQQTTQNAAWINTWNIDLTPYNVEKIRLFYTSGNNYTGDLWVDNIVITSI